MKAIKVFKTKFKSLEDFENKLLLVDVILIGDIDDPAIKQNFDFEDRDKMVLINGNKAYAFNEYKISKLELERILKGNPYVCSRCDNRELNMYYYICIKCGHTLCEKCSDEFNLCKDCIKDVKSINEFYLDMDNLPFYE
jgi:hypothetical protein